MANRLAAETSPYLLEHANNPVDWYPWSEEALDRARREDRPILLSIGYSACHWCHVMARESFSDPQTADAMNRSFICIKVDREERPDLDQVYMRAVQAMTGGGGWPMTVFLLPDGTPFFGGTYFPPDERHGMPAFKRVLAAVSEAYRDRRSDINGTASKLRAFLNQPLIAGSAAASLDPTLLDQAAAGILMSYDPVNGGFGGAPKFPQPMIIDFLLRTYQRTRNRETLEPAIITLKAMAGGGIYDQLGGGFHRYAVDERWLVPHFEKMLYDNALLARAYLSAWQLTKEPLFRRVVEETTDFVAAELTSPDGGFYSSLDADSEGEEGKYYVFTLDQVKEVLDGNLVPRFAAAFDVTAAGNWEGRNILHPVTPEAERVMAEARPALLQARRRRPRPHRDEKILSGWNGLMLRTLCDAGWAFDRNDLLDAARANARFLTERMRVGHRMLRSRLGDRPGAPGFLEDQASVADGLFALYEATFETEWLEILHQLVTEMLASFWDGSAGVFFDTAAGHETLVARPQDVTDNAVPSGTSLAVDVLLRAGALLGEESWTGIAVGVLRKLGPAAARAPLAFGRLLSALDFQLARPIELALVGRLDDRLTRQLLEVVRPRYLPNCITAQAEAVDGARGAIPLLAGRSLLHGRPAAYLCEGFLCRVPTSDPAQLRDQLESIAPG